MFVLSYGNMNRFKGQISDIQVSDDLSIVSVRMSQQIVLKAIVIETPQTASYLLVNHSIDVLFKETEVVICLPQCTAISLQNRIPARMKKIQSGQLLSQLFLDTEMGEVVSIISTNSVEKLGLAIGSDVVAMIKLNEMMLAE